MTLIGLCRKNYEIYSGLMKLESSWPCEHGTEEFSQGSQLFKLHVVVKTKLVHYTVLFHNQGGYYNCLISRASE